MRENAKKDVLYYIYLKTPHLSHPSNGCILPPGRVSLKVQPQSFSSTLSREFAQMELTGLYSVNNLLVMLHSQGYIAKHHRVFRECGGTLPQRLNSIYIKSPSLSSLMAKGTSRSPAILPESNIRHISRPSGQFKFRQV